MSEPKCISSIPHMMKGPNRRVGVKRDEFDNGVVQWHLKLVGYYPDVFRNERLDGDGSSVEWNGHVRTTEIVLSDESMTALLMCACDCSRDSVSRLELDAATEGLGE